MVKEVVNGLTGLELVLSIKRAASRHIAIHLSDLEQESVVISGERMIPFETARKLFLDTLNDFTRAIWRRVGVEIEGNEYY